MSSSRFYVVLQSLVLSAAEAFAPSDAVLAARIESAWRVQRRWEAISKNGGFEYAFEVKTWNSANRLKEHLERSARVESRDGVSRTEILSSRKDGRDDLVEAREDQRKFEQKRDGADRKTDGKKSEFPSPFDPRYREEYVFSASPSVGGSEGLSFRPRRRLDGAIAGTAEFDARGRPVRVAFGLAHPPIFTRDLSFTISLDEEGNPVRVESSGSVSLVVWKRRFESTIVIRNVVPAAE